jgi:hypothetical protein
MTDKHLYKITFVNQDQVYEVYAKNIYQGEMYGFVVIEGFIFGEKSHIVIDPTEEKLRTEFEDVERSYIPMHKVIRIDKVIKRGTAKIFALSTGNSEPSKVTDFYKPDKT